MLEIELKNKMIDDFNNGMTKKKLCEKYDVKMWLIKKEFKDIKRNEYEWKNQDTIDRYLNGESYYTLATEFKVTPPTVNKFLKDNGIGQIRKQRLMEKSKPIIDDYNSGMKLNEIFQKYPMRNSHDIRIIIDRNCIKHEPVVNIDEEEELIAKLPKAEVKAKVRPFKANDKKYVDIFDLIAGV